MYHAMFSILGMFLLFIDLTWGQTVQNVAVVNPDGQSYISELTVAGETLFFRAYSNNSGHELWATDGTKENTRLVRDIEPGEASSIPKNFVEFNDLLYFTASNNLFGNELWVSDGTREGTSLLINICPGSSSSNVGSLTVLNDTLLFRASDGKSASELWVSDGTTAGTKLLMETNPGISGSSPTFFYKMKDRVYFAANDGIHGNELWLTDGTENGTILIKDISSGLSSSNPGYFTAFNNKLFFSANDLTSGTEFWQTDGTDLGTFMVKDLKPGKYGSYPSDITLFNVKLFFRGSDVTLATGPELCVSHGTADGTDILLDINLSGSSNPTLLTVYEDILVFKAIASSFVGYELWYTDGSESGTRKHSPNISPLDNPLGGALEFTKYKNELYFTAGFDNNFGQLWKIVSKTTGTNDKIPSRIGLNVDPNPVVTFVNINLGQPVKINVVDLNGRLVFHSQVEKNVHRLDVSEYASGVYSVFDSNQSMFQKFIVSSK